MKKITIIIPAYNEEANLTTTYSSIVALIDNMPQWEWSMLFVNDGSADSTLDILNALHDEDSRVNVLSLSRNFGKENAMLAGMDYFDADAAIIMDADGQHSLDVIPEMLTLWEEGYDDVYAVRRTRDTDSALRRMLSKTYYRLLGKLSDTEVLPNAGDYRLLDRRCIKAIRNLRESNRYTKGLYTWVGFKKKAVYFTVIEREGGKSSFSYSRLFRLAIDGITSSTTFPLKLASIAGIIVSVFAFLYMAYIIIKTIIYSEPVQGFPTLICTILFMGGVQLLSIGIIGEYIGRIFMETKRRPPYVADLFNKKKIES